MATLEITVKYSPFAFIYALFRPNIVINGALERKPWGTHRFELAPGQYRIAISYPWLFSSECGKNSVDLALREGDVKRICYTARMIRFIPGKLTVEDAIPVARMLPAGRK